MLSDLQSQDMNEFKRLRMYYFWGGNSRFSCLVKVVFLLDRIASSGEISSDLYRLFVCDIEKSNY